MSSTIMPYLKSMSISFMLMFLVTLGMYFQNSLLQYGSIIIVLVANMGYQIIKTVRSTSIIQDNIKDATHEKSKTPMFKATKEDVKLAMSNSSFKTGSKMILLLILPLALYMTTGLILGIILPGIEGWKSFLLSFLLTMPFSTILSIKMGLNPAKGQAATPNEYYVFENGIVYEHMGRTYLARYPINEMNINKDKLSLEIECQPTKTSLIPNRLRLFTKDISKLQRILNKFQIKK